MVALEGPPKTRMDNMLPPNLKVNIPHTFVINFFLFFFSKPEYATV